MNTTQKQFTQEQAQAMLEALKEAQKTIAVLKTWVRDDHAPLMMVRTAETEMHIEAAIAQAEGQ